MLFGSNLLEVGIGVLFIFLLLSLLCSALSELIESLLKFRASDLRDGIGRLLSDPAVTTELLDHPLVKPLGEKPSYIPARTFSLALWSIATKTLNKNEGGVTQDITAIRKSIASLDEAQYGKIRDPLLAFIDEAGNDIDKARKNIEEWYNDAMDRVSGGYKRRTHWILIVMGLLAAAVLNIDTVNVTRALWYNDTLRHSLENAAEYYVKSNTQTPTQGSTTAGPKEGSPEEQARAALDKVNYVRGEINSLGLPIGWIAKPDPNDLKYKGESGRAVYDSAVAAYESDPRRAPDSAYSWFLKLLGIAFTALAVSQGAPFWFDVLNKIIVIRSTIKPGEKSPEEQPK